MPKAIAYEFIGRPKASFVNWEFVICSSRDLLLFFHYYPLLFCIFRLEKTPEVYTHAHITLPVALFYSKYIVSLLDMAKQGFNITVNLRLTFWCLQFSKKNAKIWWISALEFKKWLNQTIKGPFSYYSEVSNKHGVFLILFEKNFPTKVRSF